MDRLFRFLREHINSVAVVAFTAVILVFGAIDLFRPFGLRFSDLTGKVVTMDSMVRIGILTIVVVGLNLLMGYAGQVSLGQAGFYAMGAYASAILTTLTYRHGLWGGVADTWWWPWIVMVLGMVVTGAFAFAVGKPILRLKGYYLAMGTLGLGFIINIVSGQFPEITGGHDGVTDIPRLMIGSFALWPIQRYYFLVWGAAIVVILISLNIVNSRIGRALRAIHTNEIAANTSGVDTEKFKLQVFVISAVFASLAGSLYAHFQSAVSPNPFGFKTSVELVTMAAVGGLSSIWGAPFGVGALFVLADLIQSKMDSVLHLQGGEYQLIIYGVVLVLIMIFLPEGVTSSGKSLTRRIWSRASARGRKETG